MAEVWGRPEEFYGEKGLPENCEGLQVGVELALLRLSSQPSQALTLTCFLQQHPWMEESFSERAKVTENCASPNARWGKVH